MGYDLVNGSLIINEEYAAVVRSIYEMYLRGINTTEITKMLNQSNVLNIHWQRGRIEYILRHESYIGDAQLQKRGNGLHGRCRVRPLYEEYDRLGYCCLLCTGWCGHASESTVILNYYRNLKCFLKDNRCVDAISFEA